MTPAHLLLAGGSLLSLGALVSAFKRRDVQCPLPPNVLVLAETIDTDTASSLLYALDQRRGPQTLILHTRGGLAVASAQIAEAILDTDTTVVVPYMAYSGGALIALSASRLLMGEFAALTPVDPIIDEHRAIHSRDFQAPELRRVADEYLASMSGLVDRILARRLMDPQKRRVASQVLLGATSPHGWPIMRSSVAELGFAVGSCGPEWGRLLCFLTEPR